VTPQGKVIFQRLNEATRQLVRGVQALHDAGKEHRDLKPGNVIVTESGASYCSTSGFTQDLTGREFYVDQSELHSSSGTPSYMAPERLLGEAATDASDWYSVGVMLYEALTSFKPFPAMGEALKGTLPAAPRSLAADAPKTCRRSRWTCCGASPSRARSRLRFSSASVTPARCNRRASCAPLGRAADRPRRAPLAAAATRSMPW